MSQLKIELCMELDSDRESYIHGKSAMGEKIARLATGSSDIRSGLNSGMTMFCTGFDERRSVTGWS
ncbi:MAG: hypothetical protein AB7W37_17190 [Syntrophobacteraceae bacterium]